MNTLISLTQKLERIPVFIACIALFLMMAMTFADVILRSVFNAPIEAATELTRIFMAILIFSVLPSISARGEHILVDLTDGLFEQLNLEPIRDALIMLVSALMLIWPSLQVLKLAGRAKSYGDVTEYLHIPTFYIGWFIAISLWVTIAVMLCVAFMKFAAIFRKD